MIDKKLKEEQFIKDHKNQREIKEVEADLDDVSLENVLMNVEKENVQEKIIKSFLDETNIETKTEIDFPLRWTALRELQNYLAKKNLIQSAKVIESFIFTAMRFYISKKRKSREEFIKALNALKNTENNDESITKESFSRLTA